VVLARLAICKMSPVGTDGAISANLFSLLLVKNTPKIFILRACDFFDSFVFSGYPTICISRDKAVILSERFPICRKQRLYGAESKDPGDAYPAHAVRGIFAHEAREQNFPAVPT
jgi:hypothetical protein